nr:Crp/Fnr family transcriptional regulator [Pseudomonas sp.]
MANHSSLMEQLAAEPLLQSRMQGKRLTKGVHIIRQNQVMTDLFIIQRGLVKLYYVTPDGKEWVKSFVAEGEAFGSRTCQITGEGSPFAAVCLEDTDIVALPYAVFRSVLLDRPKLIETVLQLTEAIGLKKERREYELLCRTAEERYRMFHHEQPELARRLSQMDIARYLGITPIALSRIKKRVSAERQAVMPKAHTGLS